MSWEMTFRIVSWEFKIWIDKILFFTFDAQIVNRRTATKIINETTRRGQRYKSKKGFTLKIIIKIKLTKELVVVLLTLLKIIV